MKSGTAMERRSRYSECRRHEWGGGGGGGVCVWGGGGGYERWLTPFVRECAGMPQKKCLIQDVCRSDSNAF